MCGTGPLRTSHLLWLDLAPSDPRQVGALADHAGIAGVIAFIVLVALLVVANNIGLLRWLVGLAA